MSIDSSLPSISLNQYYNSINDSRIISDLDSVSIELDEFQKTYKGKVADLQPQELLGAILLYEKILMNLGKPSYYLSIMYELGGPDVDKVNSMQVRVDERTTMLQNKIIFFEVELSKKSDLEVVSKSPELSGYKHYLEMVGAYAKHTLSEESEQLLSLKELSGNQAWSKFYTDQKAKISVEYDFGKGVKKYSTVELSEIIQGKDRDKRAKALELLTKACKDREDNVLEAFNNIILDKKVNDNLRGYKFASESKLISNQISQSFVESLVKTSEDKVNIVRDYYKLKFDIMGITDPHWYDVSAPTMPADETLIPESDTTFEWEECKAIIIENFSKFHPRFGEIATEAFEKNWVDASPRERKYGGAFCSSFAPGYDPLILVNYKNKLSSVSTVAHEMGHLVHSVLTQESQSYLNCNYTMSMAEIASLACETVVFEKMFETITNPYLKLKILCEKIEEEILNIYEGGVARYNFESKMHSEFRENGPVSKEKVRELWLEEKYHKVYGDVVSLNEGCEHTWQLVAHFTYMFYNYVYASGLLTSNAIYEIIKNDDAKKEIYLDILRSGGNNWPKDLLSKLDLDIESTDFWNIGFKPLEDKLILAKQLWSEIKG
jgi:oligoendopeptidase F